MIQEFFGAPENGPFIYALVIVALLSFLVVAGTLLGMIHLPEADADLEVDWGEGHFGDHVLEFLGVASMPMSLFMLLGSCTFFVTGYSIQLISRNSTGHFLSGWMAIVPALIVTIMVCRGVGKVFAKTQFKLHTTAVASDSFLYRLVVIHHGTAKKGLAAEAKLVDEHGQTHYCLVEPRDDGQEFPQGSEVVLVERVGPKFLAVSGSIQEMDQ